MRPNDMITSKLLKIAKETPDFHIMSPQELSTTTKIAEDIWYDFINNNEEIRQYIQRRTQEDIEISHRKALAALGNAASLGNVQAIRELNQLSGILNQNNNRQIVTHYIPRPEKTKETKQQKGSEEKA